MADPVLSIAPLGFPWPTADPSTRSTPLRSRTWASPDCLRSSPRTRFSKHALERVLPHWHLFVTTICAGLPTRKHVPARTRVFDDFLVQVFGGEDRDPWLLAEGCETPVAFAPSRRPRVTAAA